MYAIFRALGKQYRAEPNATIRLPSLEAEPGDTMTFGDVLLAADDGDIRVGTPTLDGASIEVEVVRHGKDDKIVVYKMKRRKGYRKKQGHRQGFTEVRIVDIGLGGRGAKKARKAAKAEPAPAEAEAAPAEAEAGPEGAAEITDAARELAEAHGIDLSTIEGSGKDGRILKSDVERAIKEQEGE